MITPSTFLLFRPCPLRFCVILTISCWFCPDQEFGDERTGKQIKLQLPKAIAAEPSAGKRVLVTPEEYKETQVHHTLYLPKDWTKDFEKTKRRWPVIVEWTGNKYLRAGSSGTVEGAGLGFGISQGQFIWIVLPYVSRNGKENQLTWWGDEQKTVQYAKRNVPRICQKFGGDLQRILLCGFSRGAIGVNYLGLYDNEIAKLWCGFLTHDHYDGIREWKGTTWGSPLESYRAGALVRLKRLKGRPVLICQNGGTDDIQQWLQPHLSEAEFTFLPVNTEKILGEFPNQIAIHPHNDRWLLTSSPERIKVWNWVQQTLKPVPEKELRMSD